MKPWRVIDDGIEEDLRDVQLRLPFPDESTIDTARACAILHVSAAVVYRLTVTPIAPGSETMSLVAYSTMRGAPLRIEYASMVRFLDSVRERHGIPDHRPIPVFGRYRDDDLLPFPWSDTITVNDAAEALSIHPSKVLLRIESGQFEAYQLGHGAPWRISRNSLARLIASFSTRPSSVRPYNLDNIVGR